MAIATSIISEYNQDPQFYDSLEMQYRKKHVGADYFNTMFEAGLKKGRQMKVTNEMQLNPSSTDGHTSITYSQNAASEQTFTVEEAVHTHQLLFDVDEIASQFDVQSVVRSNGLYKMYDYIDKKGFESMNASAFAVQGALDLTALSTDEAKGDAIFGRIMDANATLDNADTGEQRKACLGVYTKRYLKDADKLTHATAMADSRIISGTLGFTDGVRVDHSLNLYKGSTSFDVTIKGAVAVGDTTITVDNGGTGTINAPQIGDQFTNNINGVATTFTILNVKTVTATVEYQLLLDQPIGTIIADNATLAITGYHTDYVPIVMGAPGQAVVQKDPTFEMLRSPDYHGSLFRSLSVFDHFLSAEAGRKVVMVPIKYRTIS